jgi:hypothetical protein
MNMILNRHNFVGNKIGRALARPQGARQGWRASRRQERQEKLFLFFKHKNLAFLAV